VQVGFPEPTEWQVLELPEGQAGLEILVGVAAVVRLDTDLIAGPTALIPVVTDPRKRLAGAAV
jgi:hypothetical protein